MRIRVTTGLCLMLPGAASLKCTLSVPCAKRRLIDPVSVPSLVKFVRPPDGQLEADRSGAPAQLFNACRVGTRLARQVQLLVLVDQVRRDTQFAGFDPLNLLAVPADEPLRRRVTGQHQRQNGDGTLADDVSFGLASPFCGGTLLGAWDEPVVELRGQGR